MEQAGRQPGGENDILLQEGRMRRRRRRRRVEGSGRAPFGVGPYRYSDRRQGGRSTPKVYGRDDDIDAVVSILVGDELGEEDPVVVSIVGIGRRQDDSRLLCLQPERGGGSLRRSGVLLIPDNYS